MAKYSRESLLRAMQDANIRGADLARAVDIKPSRMSQLLNGDRMHEDQIKAICEELEISADVIIFDELGSISNEYDVEVLQLYRELEPESRILSIQLMRLLRKLQKAV